jgi:hypothetical protein
MKKKGVSLSLNTIIIAILVLLVLTVLIAVFHSQIGGIVKGFSGFSKDAQTKADESRGSLPDIFGTCEEGTYKCGALNIRQKCVSGKWEDDTNCAENNQVCKDGQCQDV